MKKAFFQSVLLHILIAGLIIGVSRISFTDDKKDSLQLTMAVTMNNAGSGVSAKGVETSSIENSPNVAGNHVKNIKHQEGIAEKKVEKKKEEKKKEDKKQDKKEIKKESPKKKEIKREEVADNKTENMMQASIGAVMANRGKQSGTGAGGGNSTGAKAVQGGVDGVYSLKDVDTKPKLIKNARPVYPEYARNMRIEGRVTMSFIIDDKGNIKNLKVVKAVPENTFDNSALNAVKKWQFSPAEKGGDKVHVGMTVSLNFKLDN